MLLLMDKKRFGFWKIRRSGTSNSTIASPPGIRIGKSADPTKMAEDLFAKVKEMMR